ncbi:MAG: DUF2029 domain-containing protein [Rhodobacteraceae bacterium]|nr:DUF2029 domain-containing protein [Paracoccaceae bacterium]
MQSPAERREADARLQPFAGRVAFYLAGLTAVVSLTLFTSMILVTFVQTSQPGNPLPPLDFRVFWGAARLAAAGEPLAVHDLGRLGSTFGAGAEDYLPWLYPPGFLALVTPLGTLSFAMAYLIWTGLTVILTLWAFRPYVGGIGALWIIAALAPATYPAILLGQNSLLWMAGLLAALAALRDGRWLLSGVLIGCLTLKPHLGIMIPVALLAIGAWRTVFAAGATTVALMVLPTLLYGVEYWRLLGLGLAEHRERLEVWIGEMLYMMNLGFTAAYFGVPDAAAWALQWFLALLCGIAVAVVWRSNKVGFDLKAAVLLCSMILSAPYLWYYEAVFLVPLALFLLRGGVLSLKPLNFLILVPLWMGAVLQAFNMVIDLFDPRWLRVAYIPPLVLFCLGLCLRHAFSRPALVARAA